MTSLVIMMGHPSINKYHLLPKTMNIMRDSWSDPVVLLVTVATFKLLGTLTADSLRDRFDPPAPHEETRGKR